MKRVAVSLKARKLILVARPEIVLTGYCHLAFDRLEENVRRINPGALHRAEEYSVALLDLKSDLLRYLKLS